MGKIHTKKEIGKISLVHINFWEKIRAEDMMYPLKSRLTTKIIREIIKPNEQS